FRNRFGIIHTLQEYSIEELAKIIEANAHKINIIYEDNYIFVEIAKRCSGVPRIANRLLCRIRDYAQIMNNGIVNKEIIDEAMILENIDSTGLTRDDYRYLHSMYKNFGCTPVGVASLASSLNESKETLENSIEPFLLKQGYIVKTKTGRML